jgi:hypothetical protein
VFHQEPANHRPQNHQYSNDREHFLFASRDPVSIKTALAVETSLRG